MKFTRLILATLPLACGPADPPGEPFEPASCDLSEPFAFRELTEEPSSSFSLSASGGIAHLTEKVVGGGIGARETSAVDVCTGRVIARDAPMLGLGAVAISCRDGILGVLDSDGRVTETIETGVECLGDDYLGPDVSIAIVRGGELGFLRPDLAVDWTGFEWEPFVPIREPYGPREQFSWDGERALLVTAEQELVHVDGDSAAVTVLGGGVDGFVHEPGGRWVLGANAQTALVLADLETFEVFEVPPPDPMPPLHHLSEVILPNLSGSFVILKRLAPSTPWYGPALLWTPAFGREFDFVSSPEGSTAAVGDVVATVRTRGDRIVRLRRVSSEPGELLEDIGEVEVKVDGDEPELRAHAGRIFYGGTEVPLDTSTAGSYRELGDPTVWLEDRIVTQLDETLVQIPLDPGDPRVIREGVLEPDTYERNMSGEIDVTAYGPAMIYATGTEKKRTYWYHPLGAI